jgi:hypothetical protein
MWPGRFCPTQGFQWLHARSLLRGTDRFKRDLYEGGIRVAMGRALARRDRGRTSHRSHLGPLGPLPHDQDRAEQHDLPADHPDLVDQERQLFEDAHTPSPICRFSWQQDEAAAN